MTDLRVTTVFLILSILGLSSYSQTSPPSNLSVEWIMRNPIWMGHFPDQLQWAENSKHLFFQWNPENAQDDSLYAISITANANPRKLTLSERKALPSSGHWNKTRTQKVYSKNGDLFIYTLSESKIRQITNTIERESNPIYSLSENAIYFEKNNNVYSWHIETGLTTQITDFRSGKARRPDSGASHEQKQWVQQQEMSLMEVLRERKEKRVNSQTQRKKERSDRPQTFYYGKKRLDDIRISPDGRFVVFRLTTPAQGAERTNVPSYIQETGYTDNLIAYPKVGSPQPSYETMIYHIPSESFYEVTAEDLPGIQDMPEFMAVAKQRTRSLEKPEATKSISSKSVIMIGPKWSEDGIHAVMEVRSQDFKDRWITALDLNTGLLRNLDHQHSEAWIGGPDIPWWTNGQAGEGDWIPGEKTFWYKSEASGYSHLYTVDVTTGEKKQLTQGKFEVFSPQLSQDKKYWYFTSNEVHPGERHFYRMPINGGKATQLTTMPGNNEVTLSPDEQWLAIRYSNSNTPWELYLQPNKKGVKAQKITDSQSDEFASYPWRAPEVINFPARDGAQVHARVYRPENAEAHGSAVIFVHGAGYLQNAHKWWSSYFREYMFHNLLVEKGYTVMDIDYRASAGYGRDWRTAIYRHMGGKDLTDQVDGAEYLVEKYDINPESIGIYGGSYGGFITLMAMFTEPEVFAAGAALRPVTDWTHYHHQYTAGILNSPQDDSIAYVRSSPIYHAEGLKGALLICHGMVDVNVHFQDVVRLNQRLIELGKENWQVAMYPVEGHGFRAPSSWTDEYRRILKLFEENLK